MTQKESHFFGHPVHTKVLDKKHQFSEEYLLSQMYRKKAKSSLSKSTMIMCIANGGTVLRKAGQILANIDKYLDKC